MSILALSTWIKEEISADIGRWNNFESMLQVICSKSNISRNVMSKNKNSTVDLWINDIRALGGLYTGEERFFSMSIDKNYYNYEPGIMELVLGFLPKQVITISTFSRSQENYDILLYLSLYLSKNFEGLVEIFGINEDIVNVDIGKYYKIPYETNLSFEESIFVDSLFLQEMIQQKQTYLIEFE